MVSAKGVTRGRQVWGKGKAAWLTAKTKKFAVDLGGVGNPTFLQENIVPFGCFIKLFLF